MKKQLFGCALAFLSASAFAAGVQVCDGTQTTAGSARAITGAAGNFVVSTFTPKCSPNVALAYAQTSTAFATAAASLKGKTYYSGNTNGGGITSDGLCSGTCAADTVTTNANTRLSASS